MTLIMHERIARPLGWPLSFFCSVETPFSSPGRRVPRTPRAQLRSRLGALAEVAPENWTGS